MVQRHAGSIALPIPYLGELAALAAALAWSVAIILFRQVGERVPPVALNLFKNLFALILFVLTSLALGDGLLRAAPMRDYWLLLASGVIGIGVCDQLFFMSLNRVGAGLNAIITTSYSPSVILVSFIFLGERLGPVQLLGVALIVGAVLLVAWKEETDRSVAKGRPPSSPSPPPSPSSAPSSRPPLARRTLLVGVVCGVLAMATQAVSIVMVKRLLETSPLFWANSWRLLGGIATSVAIIVLVRSQRVHARAALVPANWRLMVPGALMGTYVSLILWLAGMKYTQASIASAINQTSTLWTFLLAALWLKEPVTPVRLAGLALGGVGVTMVTFG